MKIFMKIFIKIFKIVEDFLKLEVYGFDGGNSVGGVLG